MRDGIQHYDDRSRMKMLMNRMLSLVLLLLISHSAAAEVVFWVLGSFLDEDVARVEAGRISNDAGIEVLLVESLVNSKVQYRLLTGVMVAPSDQAALRQELMKAGVPEPWTLRFDDVPPYIETAFSNEGTGNTLSAAELEEIDSMLSNFDDEYAEGALMEIGMSTKEISLGLVSATSVSLAGNFVVVGSYSSIEKANDHVGKLGNAFPEVLAHGVTVQRKEVFGEIVYRVMIGPVLSIEEKSLMGSLSEWGGRGAWLLSGITAPIDISLQNSGPDQAQGKNISQAKRGFRIPSKSGSQSSVTPVKSSREQDDFNPVSLRKSSAKFPDPRNKH